MKLCYEAEGRAIFPKIGTTGMTVLHTADIPDYSVMQMFGVFLIELMKTRTRGGEAITVVYTDYLHVEWLLDILKELDDFKVDDRERDNKATVIEYMIKKDNKTGRQAFVHFISGSRTGSLVTGDVVLVPFAEYLPEIVMRVIVTQTLGPIIVGVNDWHDVSRHKDLNSESVTTKMWVGDKAPNKKQKK